MSSTTTWWKCENCAGILPERLDTCFMCGTPRNFAFSNDVEWELREELEEAITKACETAGYHFGIGEGCPVAARAALAWFKENRTRLEQIHERAPAKP